MSLEGNAGSVYVGVLTHTHTRISALHETERLVKAWIHGLRPDRMGYKVCPSPLVVGSMHAISNDQPVFCDNLVGGVWHVQFDQLIMPS